MLVAGMGLGAHAAAQNPTIHYQERVPYSSLQADGNVAGLTATPAALALQRAGLSATWARTPGQRQLALIQEGDGLHCGLGWFRNAERGALGKFSKALYRDRPFGALARNDSGLRAGISGEEAIAATTELLLVKEGYSYGTVLDRLSTVYVTPEEAAFTAKAGPDGLDLLVLQFPRMGDTLAGGASRV